MLYLLVLSCGLWLAGAVEPYDFRTSDAYRRLAVADRERLEQVARDLVLLRGALDLYADRHEGSLPATLDELVPACLAGLPSDPFATRQTQVGRATDGYTVSKGGLGYQYRSGAPGNRAWIIASVGLPDFPFLAERGNMGLYICKGTWISGINPVVGNRFQNAQGNATNGNQPAAAGKQ